MNLKTKINSYNFNKIPSNMAKEFGTMQKGDEMKYYMVLFPMEGNLLKTSRLHRIKSGREVSAAIRICLFTISGYLKNTEYDLAEYETEENRHFAYALLMSIDPFTNDELKKIADGEYDLNSADELKKYFTLPVICLLRIEKSVELWSKEYGNTGYIDFLERQIGRAVERGDYTMDYAYELKSF